MGLIGTFKFLLWVFYILVAVALLLGAKFKNNSSQILAVDVSKGIQGICALLIILHHLTQAVGAETAFMYDKGVMLVGVFFFFSGYGLFISMKTKQNYLKGFFRKRFTAILIPFYACILVFTLCAWATGTHFKTTELISTLTGWQLINSHMWYIVEIAVLYLGFYCIFRWIKKEAIALSAMGVFIATLTVGSLVLCHGSHWFQGEWWYNSTFLFFIGILVAKFGDKISAFAKRYWWALMGACTAATVVFYKATNYMLQNYSYYSEPVYGQIGGLKEKFLCLSCQLPMVIFFVFALLLLMMKISFGNPIMKYLGKISLELYLIHNLYLTYLRSNVVNIKSSAMYGLLTIVLSIITADLINRFDRWLIALINAAKGSALDTHSSESRKNSCIDCIRLIMMFLVVCIHVPFTSGNMGNVFIAFGKTAVPFLLVASGYFLYRDDSSEFMNRLIKQAKKLLILTVGAHIVYLAVEGVIRLGNGTADTFASTYFTATNLKNFLLWNMSPVSDHLWFLGSMLYALVILMVLSKLNIHKKLMFVSPILLAAYIWLSFNSRLDYYVTRNAVLVTLPYMMMGCLIQRYYHKLQRISGIALLVATLLLGITNMLELKRYGSTGVPFFSAELMTYTLFLIALKYPKLGAATLTERLGRRCTLFVYIVHMMPVILISGNSKIIQYFGPVVIFGLTLMLAVVFNIKYFWPIKRVKQQLAAISSENDVLQHNL